MSRATEATAEHGHINIVWVLHQCPLASDSGILLQMLVQLLPAWDKKPALRSPCRTRTQSAVNDRLDGSKSIDNAETVKTLAQSTKGDIRSRILENLRATGKKKERKKEDKRVE
jgi:hypothetical protein